MLPDTPPPTAPGHTPSSQNAAKTSADRSSIDETRRPGDRATRPWPSRPASPSSSASRRRLLSAREIATENETPPAAEISEPVQTRRASHQIATCTPTPPAPAAAKSSARPPSPPQPRPPVFHDPFPTPDESCSAPSQTPSSPRDPQAENTSRQKMALNPASKT